LRGRNWVRGGIRCPLINRNVVLPCVRVLPRRQQQQQQQSEIAQLIAGARAAIGRRRRRYKMMPASTM